ncbi:unnamed protein product [Paramecium sonneborni]|uniref:Uncharacterized protein n=1 Tax=Paramecium sonneborni TaxID=65129 RepID=A0A8S1P032_9CILI|nr:unnamed protein product [Paramecium sonneborni]
MSRKIRQENSHIIYFFLNKQHYQQLLPLEVQNFQKWIRLFKLIVLMFHPLITQNWKNCKVYN